MLSFAKALAYHLAQEHADQAVADSGSAVQAEPLRLPAASQAQDAAVKDDIATDDRMAAPSFGVSTLNRIGAALASGAYGLAGLVRGGIFDAGYLSDDDRHAEVPGMPEALHKDHAELR